MGKQQLIQNIREHNPSAQVEFLSDFDEDALYAYLRRLRHLQRPRGMHSLWMRHEGPAMVGGTR